MLTPLPAAIRTPHQLTRKPTITTGNRVPQRDDLWCLPEVLRLRAGLEPGPAAVSMLERAADVAAGQQGRVLESRCRRDLADRTVREASRRLPAAACGANGSRTCGA